MRLICFFSAGSRVLWYRFLCLFFALMRLLVSVDIAFGSIFYLSLMVHFSYAHIISFSKIFVALFIWSLLVIVGILVAYNTELNFSQLGGIYCLVCWSAMVSYLDEYWVVV